VVAVACRGHRGHATQRLITTEQGAKATFTIALKVKPTADVTVALQSSNENEGAVSPTTVTFTSENYAAPQTVRVTG
jgi:hypothetical protein